MESPLDCTSTNFEKIALQKFRFLATCLPEDIRVFREPWGRSTVLCLDFDNCPHLFMTTQAKINLIATAIQQLGLANSIIFRIGKKIMGWKRIDI
jgi:hypothetical protein